MLINKTVKEFTNELSSKNPTPGGGSVAALFGATGVALTNMVIMLTVDKKGYEEYNDELKDILIKTKELESLLLFGIDEDKDAFNCVSAVFGMPKDTEKEKEDRKIEMQKALKIATVPPFKVMELSLHTLTITKNIIGKTNKNAASDLGVAALALSSATKAAWLNVLINISSIKDDEFKNEFIKKGSTILKKVEKLSDSIYENIEKSFF